VLQPGMLSGCGVGRRRNGMSYKKCFEKAKEMMLLNCGVGEDS